MYKYKYTFFGETMSIELKNKVKCHYLTILLSCAAILIGALGSFLHIDGFWLIPVTAALLATLFTVEKKRILSVAVSVFLIITEIIIGASGYFSPISLSSVMIALIISVCYIKKTDKFDCALFAILVTVVALASSALLFIIDLSGASSVIEAYDYFLEFYEGLKDSVTESLMNTTAGATANNPALSADYISELFDAYLNCIVALLTILAFVIVGITLKIFLKLINSLTEDSDKTRTWNFVPPRMFAYFYFALAILSIFKMNMESVLAVSILNLYMIFMFVFAYVGYKVITAMLKSSGKSTFSANATVIVLTLLFSSFALQMLAVAGAFAVIKFAKISPNTKIQK